MTPEVPSGFALHGRKSPVTDAWEPLYVRETDGVVRLGLRVAAAHCNSRGFLHGGVLAALADNAMGLSYGMTLRRAQPDLVAGAVTLSLTIDYVAAGKIGAWLEVRPRVIKSGRSIGFVDALVVADEEAIARASATFKLL